MKNVSAHRSIRERRRQVLQRLSSFQSDEIHVLKTTGLTRGDWYLETTINTRRSLSLIKYWAKMQLFFQKQFRRLFLTCDAFFSEPVLGRLRLCPRVAEVVSGRVVLLDGVTWPWVVTGDPGVNAGGLRREKHVRISDQLFPVYFERKILLTGRWLVVSDIRLVFLTLWKESGQQTVMSINSWEEKCWINLD